MLNVILRDRKWDQTQKLRDKVVMLFHDYQRVGREIKEKYKEYVKKQQQEVRTETRIVNPSRDEEEEKEDWDKETEVVDVVEEPAPRKEFRARGGGGQGRNRGRGLKREGGRGRRDYHRDFEQGASRGRDRNEREGQKRDGSHRNFNKDDLPPRFQRMQQQKNQKLNEQYQQRRHQVPY
ncbi:protein MNN4-like [Haliotis rubra]|uniref:protein MNN4-like n=1 Tax=Haliotis rubra TaxID=36100 RepID=UPI001EE4FD52|nr:protein MNN4-like [Haliotis rubra]